MRIAQVAPLIESVPPKMYGGTERIVSYLTEELVRLGHQVTLFASGDSVTSATLVSAAEESLRLKGDLPDFVPWSCIQLDQVRRNAREFDVIHSHIDHLPYPLFNCLKMPVLSTMHGRLDLKHIGPIYECFKNIPLVSISNSQRSPIPDANWVDTVYHGMPLDLLGLQPQRGDYFAFIGRISPEKGVDRAVAVARECGIPLKIAAKVDENSFDYYETVIKPLFKDPLVEYIGEISEHEKQELLGNALALLFLIDWPEPFGLAMIEAMACGTPVIACRSGSVPEVVDDGITGFIVDDPGQVPALLEHIEAFDRTRCRCRFEERFSVERMAQDYLAVYKTLQYQQSGLRMIQAV